MTLLLLDGHYIFKKTPRLSWGELLFGLQHGYVNEKGVTDYICDALTIDAPNEAFEIASLETQEQYLVRGLLETLNEQDSRTGKETSEAWLFLLLSFTYEHKNEYDDPLSLVEELYADFDYPEKIASLIRYMPPQDGSNGSEELLFNQWKNIISNYEIFFESRANAS
ncbi:DUF2247 family protein [Pseudomonas sp. R1-15]|uniref:DUF2247 family protein n=1 Tax=Pseudomonas sp. R1-15 TaxID=2817399 RepID=UPI003DAA1AEE